MSNNAGTCKIAKFEAVEEIDEMLQEFADDFFEVVSIDYTDDGKEQLVGYMRSDAKPEDLQQRATEWGIKLPEYSWEVVSSEDWLTENVVKFAPVETDDFYVYGKHEKYTYEGEKIGLKVYAATAFGSEHQTTKSCLNVISEINRNFGMQKNVLDVGTGSGILSLACAKLWPEAKITAVDIDDESVKVTKQNAIDNAVNTQIKALLSDGYADAEVKKNAPYDVILANILARPLIAMAPDMAKSLKKGGYAVISGFIDEQVDWVIGEHEKYGLKLVKIFELDNWRAGLLEKI